MKTTLDLNGTWEVRAIDAYHGLPPDKRRCLHWLPATVPGTIHTDLLAAGVIPDPYYRTNENDVQWVDRMQWLYRRSFVVTVSMLRADRVFLVADGLDTYAAIRINGFEIARTANMFVGHRFEVKRYLHPGTNLIEILFHSATITAAALEKRHGALKVSHGNHRVYVRKAQYSFGWDWGPVLATCGIWRPISLQSFSGGRLDGPRVRVLSVDRHRAVVEVETGVERYRPRPLRLHVTIVGAAVIQEREEACKGRRARVRFAIRDPQLWWPNGSGEQPLYKAFLSLRGKENEIDRTEVSFAIRTIRLRQEKDAQGRSFVFEVNGVPIYCRGVDWIPSDNFIPRLADSTYATLLRMAKDANMNMIRVWGGGIYEQDIFYDLCDRAGLMVWQDFMYACGEYPEESWFLREAKREAEAVVERLRNHPSIVLWCGNNECEWSFCVQNPGKSPDDMTGTRIFRDLLPEVCNRVDGSRPYWRSSPFGQGFPNAESNGNHHQWIVWSAWQDFKAYERDNARFVTEFGFQSPANRLTMEEVTLPGDRHPQSEVMEHHNKQIEGTERLLRFMAAHYRVDVGWDRFIMLGQLVQAEALKVAVEHWRRRKFDTAGSLFWQLNDCWPVSSWSVIDSALRPKAGYYFARRFFAPILLSVKRGEAGLEVWVTNDRHLPVSGRIVVGWRSMNGERRGVIRKKLSINGNATRRMILIDGRKVGGLDPARWYLHAALEVDGAVVSENRYFLSEPKHLDLRPDAIRADLRADGENRYRLTLRARRFAKNVSVEIVGEDVYWEDNFFDLDAGSTKTLQFTSAGSLRELRNRLRIRQV